MKVWACRIPAPRVVGHRGCGTTLEYRQVPRNKLRPSATSQGENFGLLLQSADAAGIQLALKLKQPSQWGTA
jgi:hypothetical protein